MRGGKGRRVIQSIADHEDVVALRLQRLDDRDFVCRRQAGLPILDAKLMRYRRDGGRPVAGEHQEAKPALAERFRHRGGIGPSCLADGNSCCLSRVGKGDERSVAALRRGRALVFGDTAELGAAEPRFLAVNTRADALARLLDGAVIRSAFARPQRQRGCQRMAAR